MKRCPKCSFLYLDSDQLCDLDQTLLIADDFGGRGDWIDHSSQKPEKRSIPATLHQRKLNLRAVSAATVAGLVIVLMLLFSFQKMRPTLQASPGPPISNAPGSLPSEESQVAQQASIEVSGEAATAQQESEPSSAPDNPTLSKPSSSPTARTIPETRPDSSRVRVSSNPVSTGNNTKPTAGPVTIRLANGSTLQADEVWRTKTGTWYRRKGIVTLLRPNRVRAKNN